MVIQQEASVGVIDMETCPFSQSLRRVTFSRVVTGYSRAARRIYQGLGSKVLDLVFKPHCVSPYYMSAELQTLND